jgi:hypothetical protein
LFDQKERKNQDKKMLHRYMPTLARLFVLLPALFEQIVLVLKIGSINQESQYNNILVRVNLSVIPVQTGIY